MTFKELYEEIAVQCIRYLGYNSLSQVDALTWPEYRLLIKGARLRQVDEDYRQHMQAYLNMLANAERPAGKGKRRKVYSTFKKFYDYDKAIKKVTGEPLKKKSSRFASLKKYLKEKQDER